MNILVLCTGNSARSIMAEALFNKMGEGELTAYSAGSKPVGVVNPVALKLLASEGFDTSQFRSKSWDEFTGAGGVGMDIVITVCGNAAGETCPIWLGAPITVHWGFPDPAGIEGTNAEKLTAFKKVYQGLASNISAFLTLDLAHMKAEDLREKLLDIHAVTEPVNF